MKGLRLRTLSVIIAGIMVLIPAILAADSPVGTQADKVTRATSKAMPAGAVPAGATIVGISTTTAALVGATVVVGGAAIVVGTSSDDDETATGTQTSAAHHAIVS